MWGFLSYKLTEGAVGFFFLFSAGGLCQSFLKAERHDNAASKSEKFHNDTGLFEYLCILNHKPEVKKPKKKLAIPGQKQQTI